MRRRRMAGLARIAGVSVLIATGQCAPPAAAAGPPPIDRTRLPAAAHWPFTQLQLSMAGKPHTPIMPSFAQRAFTPSGSVGLFTFTQAG